VFSQPIRYVMDKHKLLTVAPETTVYLASQKMAKHNAGAVLVVRDEGLIGIFTERDVVFRVVARGLESKATPVADVMTPSPKTIDPDKSFGFAMLLMHENGFRHLPVIEDGKPIGIVSARNALDPDLEEFVAEARRRTHLRQSG